jgi:hypothetical protein
VEAMMSEYHRTGKGDYFRVLYGRICENLSMPEIAKILNIDTSRAENYFKAGKKRLAAIFEDQVRKQVERYSKGEEAEEEFQAEWREIGEFLMKRDGLETSIAKVYEQYDPEEAIQRQNRAITGVMNRMTGVLPKVPDKSS